MSETKRHTLSAKASRGVNRRVFKGRELNSCPSGARKGGPFSRLKNSKYRYILML
jgi:hypothetical protein